MISKNTVWEIEKLLTIKTARKFPVRRMAFSYWGNIPQALYLRITIKTKHYTQSLIKHVQKYVAIRGKQFSGRAEDVDILRLYGVDLPG